MINQQRGLNKSLYIVFVSASINRMGAFVFPLLAVYLTEARGMSIAQAGSIISFGSIGLLVGSLIGGVLVDKWSRKYTLVLSLIINVIGYFGLMFHFESIFIYIMCLFVGLVGMGMYSPAANTIIADITPEKERSFAYAVNYICTNIGMGIGPMIGGLLIAYSYEIIFLGNISTALVCAVLIAIGIQNIKITTKSTDNTSKSTITAASVFKKHSIVFFFCIFSFFFMAPLIGLEYSMPLLVKNALSQLPFYIGVVYSINSFFIILTSFLIEKYIRDRNEYFMMILGGFLWVIGLLIPIAYFSLNALLLCTIVWTAGEIIVSILVPSFISKNTTPAFRGRFMALNNVVLSIARLTLPMGLGYIWEAYGYTQVLYVLASIPAVGLLFYAAMYVFVQARTAPLASTGLASEDTP